MVAGELGGAACQGWLWGPGSVGAWGGWRSSGLIWQPPLAQGCPQRLGINHLVSQLQACQNIIAKYSAALGQLSCSIFWRGRAGPKSMHAGPHSGESPRQGGCLVCGCLDFLYLVHLSLIWPGSEEQLGVETDRVPAGGTLSEEAGSDLTGVLCSGHGCSCKNLP